MRRRNAYKVSSTRGGTSYHDRLRDCAIEAVLVALAREDGNRTRAARRLGLQRTYLLRLIRELGLTHVIPRGSTGSPSRRRSRRPS